MKKNLHFYAIVFVLLMTFGSQTRLSAQAASATWALTANGNASTSGSVTASALAKGSSIGNVSYSANGSSATGWWSWAQNTNGYYQYSITPTGGQSLTVNSIAFDHSCDSSFDGAVAYSLASNFSNSAQVGTFTSGTTVGHYSAATNIVVPSGTTLYVRVYAWYLDWDFDNVFRNRNVVISGTICPGMAITTQPATQTVCTNSTMTLTSAFTNAVSYQWQKNGANIAGATAATYVKPNVAAADAGSYTVIGTNACGATLTSNAAVITMNIGPAVNTSAASGSICLGSSTQITTAASIPTGVTNGTNTNDFSIPDNNTTGISSAITIPETCASAANVGSVLVNISHGNNADLDIFLKAPNGTQIALAQDKGGTGNNYAATFRTGGNNFPNGSTSLNGIYAPEQAFSNLTGSATGTWTLFVRDDANGTTGTLTSWTLNISNITCGNLTYSWSPATGLSNASIASPIATPTATTNYVLTVSSPNGCSTTATVPIAVSPVSVGGSIAGSASVCAVSNSGTLTLSGHTGSVVRWESSVNNFATAPTQITNTTTTLSYSNLSATTSYRAVVASGACSSALSAVATITVSAASVGGTVSGSDTVCNGYNSGALTLTGHTGTISGWESSLDNFATAGTPIANATTTLNYSNLSATTSYRAVVVSGSCASSYSSVATITMGSATTWDGNGWSNGAPNSASAVTFSGPYTSAGNLAACSVTVNNNAAVTIASGNDLTINGALTVAAGSTFTLENNANLVQVSNAVNSGNIVVKRNSSALKRQDYTLWSSPVTGQNLFAFSPLTIVSPTSRFYTYDTATNLYASIVTPSATSFATGLAYLIRMPNNHPTATPTTWAGQFSGVPHNGDINVTMVNNGLGQRFNLVGNPYPSPIDMNEFIADNAGKITGTLYFWRKTNNELSPSYCTWTTLGFTNNGEAQVFNPNDILQTAQGFFVEAAGNATTLQFNNSQRIGDNTGQFFRTSETVEKNRIWLNATNETGVYSQMLVGYVTGATLGDDYGIDAKYINDGPIALSSMLDETRYAIQGRPVPFEASDVVPLNFRASEAGTFTIAIDHVDGLFSAEQDIFLRDNLNGATHDLKVGAYSFTTEAGTFATRFELFYQTALGTANPEFDGNNVVVYNHNGNIAINSGSITMDNVQVFDIRGRLLLSQKGINASQVTLGTIESDQVLIVKITSDAKQTVTKKVMN